MGTGSAPTVQQDFELLADWDAWRGKILEQVTAAPAAVPF
jgi:hypothetical protein